MILREFVDRTKDINRIEMALRRCDCQLVVVYGRRRIGKSTLIKHVLRQGQDLYFLSDQTSEQNQRQLFANLVANRIEGFNKVVYPDWETLLNLTGA